MNITYDAAAGRFVLPQVDRVVVTVDGEPFAEFDIPTTPFAFEVSRLPRDEPARTLVVYTYCGDERVGTSSPVLVGYPDVWTVRVEPTSVEFPAAFDAGRALLEAWATGERRRACPPDCPDCAYMEGPEQ